MSRKVTAASRRSALFLRYSRWHGGCRSEGTDGGNFYWAAVFFIIAIIAAIFGFGGIAAGAAGIAKILFFAFLVFAVVAFLFGRRIPTG